MDFYGEVLLELTTALGAACLAGSKAGIFPDLAVFAARESAARSRPGSPVRKQVRVATTGNLAQAPVLRSVLFMLLGLFVAIAGIASLTR